MLVRVCDSNHQLEVSISTMPVRPKQPYVTIYVPILVLKCKS